MTVLVRAWAWLDSRTARRMTQLLALLALLLSLMVTAQQYRLTDCLARYNDASAYSTSQRAAAAESDRRALDVMIGEISSARGLPPAQAGAQVEAAMTTYLETRARADEQRAANPMPSPPSQRC